jgi:hypothetical protein
LAQEFVYRETKADNRLVIEIPEMVRKWTARCLEEEKAVGADAPGCWRDAAAAVYEYASGFDDGPLIEQVYRLRSNWLQRAGELQASSSVPVVKEPPVAVAPESISPQDKGVRQSASIRPVPRKLRPDKPHGVAKVVAGQDSPEKAPSAKQRKKLTASGKHAPKPEQLTNTREINVVPAANVLQKTRLKKLRQSSDEVHAGDTVEAPPGIGTLFEELDNLFRTLECLFLKCAEDAN